jgi:catalase-peroxidase
MNHGWRSAWLVVLALVGVIGVSVGLSPTRGEEYEEKRAEGEGAGAKCPMTGAKSRHTAAGAVNIGDWWPNQLNLRILHQNSPMSDPMGEDFDYAAEFAKLDLEALKKDIEAVLTTSQDWWPADYGHYGGLFIRLAWHSAGTYRTTDGRGGSASGTHPLRAAEQLAGQREPRQGAPAALADQAEVRPQDLVGRPDGLHRQRRARVDGIRDLRVRRRPRGRLGARGRHQLGPGERVARRQALLRRPELLNPLAASQMGLIYVNPEGPNGKPDPLAAAKDIRITFARMAMNDEETVALIAGGHTLGKCHGAGRARTSAPSPRAPPRGAGARLEERVTARATPRTRSPAASRAPGRPRRPSGRTTSSTPLRLRVGAGEEPGRRVAVDAQGRLATVPDAHVPDGKKHKPFMLTTDLALKVDPIYGRSRSASTRTRTSSMTPSRGPGTS